MSSLELSTVSTMFEKAMRRLWYYGSGYSRLLVPWEFTEKHRDKILKRIDDVADKKGLFDRVNYYNRLEPAIKLEPTTSLQNISRSKSRYFLDTSQYIRFFPKKLKLDYLFGDITEVPEFAAFLKSRPIHNKNQNSVLLNLDKFRHFQLYHDRNSWKSKQAKAVWRGSFNNALRRGLIDRHENSPFADVGSSPHSSKITEKKPFLTPFEQLKYRYIISIEGVDVATNLKWIMASNSVCLMPKSRYETWFMEGRLCAGQHFVELQDDFSDLEEKIEMLETNPKLAMDIVQNANAHVASFHDKSIEKLISLLVLQKYFEATSQLPSSEFTPYFFS